MIMRLLTFNPLTDYQVNVYCTCITQSDTQTIKIISGILLDSTLMQILLSDWLGDCILSAICVQWLKIIYEMVTFFCFSTVLEEHFDANR